MLAGKKKLLMGVVAFFAPQITQATTGEIGWRKAVELSVLAAVGYCAAEAVADAGRGVATTRQQELETLAAARAQPPPRPRRSQQEVV